MISICLCGWGRCLHNMFKARLKTWHSHSIQYWIFIYFHALMKSAFLLSKGLLCLYDKQNNTWLFVDMEFLFSCSTLHLTRELSSLTLEEKFHIYARPCIILYLLNLFTKANNGKNCPTPSEFRKLIIYIWNSFQTKISAALANLLRF